MSNFYMNSTREKATHLGYCHWCVARCCAQVNDKKNQLFITCANCPFSSCNILNLTGPISSSFVNKYGCRGVAIAGSILTSVCLLASYYATNVFTLIITIGTRSHILLMFWTEQYGIFLLEFIFFLSHIRHWSWIWFWHDLSTGYCKCVDLLWEIPIYSNR